MNNKKLEEIIEELTDLYEKVADEHRDSKDNFAREYWQGKKDAFRTALALLNPENTSWKLLNKTSPGGRALMIDRLKSRLEDARYNIGSILYELKNEKKVHYQTKMNLINWISVYDLMAEKNEVIPTPDALDVY